MKISEIAERTKLRVSTIRYYEKMGLCPSIERGQDGTRQFTAKDLEWLELLASLRETGMPIAEMQQFALLYKGGDATVLNRKAVLLQHVVRLEERQMQLDRCADILRRKLAFYDEILEKPK